MEEPENFESDREKRVEPLNDSVFPGAEAALIRAAAKAVARARAAGLEPVIAQRKPPSDADRGE